ncbi:MAG: DUF455 family protein [Deltaproteobacteria bacterium]|nr:DUF455 family protein [Deltaproteobacteria bacterium]
MDEGREWAKGLLLGTSLEDKLRPPPSLAIGGAPELRPPAPGRPPKMGLAESGERLPFPSVDSLADPVERGRALHFFANHELLAIELMALALLRFPEAPVGFREGLVHTIREEQAHFLAYQSRMATLGVGFGELPLSGYFWRAISGMQRPLDYVAAMSLTLEQANLDYALRYQEAFLAHGDPETAQVLEVIRNDEIRHVAHGVKWWAPLGGGELDFEAYRRNLPATLSPRRAKGLSFDRSGRLQAGLTAEFIDDLYVHHNSRAGRPKVWLYRPDTEDRLAQRGVGKEAALVCEDLAPLLLFLAGPEDVVELPALPSSAHLAGLLALGFDLPERRLPSDPVHHPFGPLEVFGEATAEDRARLGIGGTPTPAQLYDKRWAAQVLADYQPKDPRAQLPEWARPVVVASTEELEPLRALCKPYTEWIILKAPFSSSGRHRVRLPTRRPMSDAEVRTAQGLLREGPVRGEAWLERVLDLSVQLELSPDPKIVGAGVFYSSPRGHYLGHALGGFGRHLSPELHRALAGFDLWGELQQVGAYVAKVLLKAGHRGRAGVDLLLYRTDQGLHLHPLLEINPRTTMGHVARALEAHLAPGHSGQLQLLPVEEAQKATPTSTGRRHKGRLVEANLWLTDPARAHKVAVRMIVDPVNSR